MKNKGKEGIQQSTPSTVVSFRTVGFTRLDTHPKLGHILYSSLDEEPIDSQASPFCDEAAVKI